MNYKILWPRGEKRYLIQSCTFQLIGSAFIPDRWKALTPNLETINDLGQNPEMQTYCELGLKKHLMTFDRRTET